MVAILSRGDELTQSLWVVTENYHFGTLYPRVSTTVTEAAWRLKHRQLECLLNTLVMVKQRNVKDPHYWLCVRKFHQWQVHKWPAMQKSFPCHDVIMARSNAAVVKRLMSKASPFETFCLFFVFVVVHSLFGGFCVCFCFVFLFRVVLLFFVFVSLCFVFEQSTVV